MAKPSSLLSALVTIATVGTLLGTYTAFTSTSSNAGNTVTSGTVAISDNDSGSVLFNLSGMKPSDAAVSKCIKVDYTGSLNSNVTIYGSVSGSLASYLNLTVTRGTDSSPSFSACTNFSADATDYLGSGAGVIYSGLLSSFPSSYASGIVDPKAATPETWSTSETHSYKFTVSLVNNSAAQALSGSASFTWEARNL